MIDFIVYEKVIKVNVHCYVSSDEIEVLKDLFLMVVLKNLLSVIS